MKLPRDISGLDLARALGQFGYVITRQSGSHVRLTLPDSPQHHLTVPAHAALKIGTLAAILTEVAVRQGTDRAELLRRLGY